MADSKTDGTADEKVKSDSDNGIEEMEEGFDQCKLDSTQEKEEGGQSPTQTETTMEEEISGGETVMDEVPGGQPTLVSQETEGETKVVENEDTELDEEGATVHVTQKEEDDLLKEGDSETGVGTDVMEGATNLMVLDPEKVPEKKKEDCMK